MLEYQSDRINLIKEILPLLGDKYILKGGTALYLYYGLDRYSEDVDLDSKTSNMNFINMLKNHREYKNWNVTIKKKYRDNF
ncbi:nucleotidyl transferase AbiEii/AbiGii toxin family protein [Taylorella equigenitalis]|uniref:nucleotidyl transferase AbiEii/AbiGii toxin family protein n=1 Tax=Taylorella equigenitalis TaxID=29575 RepID=UPI000B283A64|nr:nucleotidyl transferase AbiEii/AbiGii toxin family protein [Taylorella equigenitalis]